jgi:type IV pilus assembly protein PilX
MHTRQNGAALIIGLVLLMVLTVLAISAMRTATLDLTMAGNAQFRENAFQLAESGIQSTLRNIETSAIDLTVIPDCPGAPRPWSAADLPWDGPVEVPVLRGRYETRLCYQGATTDMPTSSIGRFRQLHYRIESRGRTDQRNAEAIHAQGFYREVAE